MASEKVTAMIEEIKAMSVLELSELVHEIEDVFGVSAAAAVAAAPVAGTAAAALCHQGAGLQGRGRGAQEEARGSRRFCRTQVIDPYTDKNLRAIRRGGFFVPVGKPHRVSRQKACRLLRTDFVRRWRTKSTLAA